MKISRHGIAVKQRIKKVLPKDIISLNFCKQFSTIKTITYAIFSEYATQFVDNYALDTYALSFKWLCAPVRASQPNLMLLLAIPVPIQSIVRKVLGLILIWSTVSEFLLFITDHPLLIVFYSCISLGDILNVKIFMQHQVKKIKFTAM